MKTTMELHDFGWTIRAMKRGESVCRAGWNGQHTFIFIEVGKSVTTSQRPMRSGKQLFMCCPVMDHICMKTADNMLCIGWLASQADMLAEDWELVIHE